MHLKYIPSEIITTAIQKKAKTELCYVHERKRKRERVSENPLFIIRAACVRCGIFILLL